ncbi:MAG: hypothetical protein BWX66_02136 [Deltaproteobacteria bacterium ADurb.Bin058]|nr:MAG: hypothetical protein BWX66_02136 [Deltaproteobacteria bacterium ADurb.Bin058]
MTTTGDLFARRAWPFIFYAFGALRMIARAAKTDGGLTLENSTTAIPPTSDPLTGVVNRGFLAKSILLCKPLVADTEWTFRTNCTITTSATVHVDTEILERVATATAGDEKQCQQRQSSLKHENPPSS